MVYIILHPHSHFFKTMRITVAFSVFFFLHLAIALAPSSMLKVTPTEQVFCSISWIALLVKRR